MCKGSQKTLRNVQTFAKVKYIFKQFKLIMDIVYANHLEDFMGFSDNLPVLLNFYLYD